MGTDADQRLSEFEANSAFTLLLSALSTNNSAREEARADFNVVVNERTNEHQGSADTDLDLGEEVVAVNQETSLPLIRETSCGATEDYAAVLQSIREVISCCACFSSEFSMKECSNGHLLCHTCFLTLRQDEHPQCPTCRANLYPDTRRALIAQKVLSELPDVCSACNLTMLHKDLHGHKLNDCSKRRVACGLAPLGCPWCGQADEYRQHYAECFVRKILVDRPIEENLENVLSRFRKREQSLRETFQCFSTVFRHLEGHELQTVSVTLSPLRVNQGKMVMRSDQFHANQSRWTLELSFDFEEPQVGEALPTDPSLSEPSSRTTTEDNPLVTNAGNTDSTEQVNNAHSEAIEVGADAVGFQSRERSAHNLAMRQRRTLRTFGAARHRPYPEWFRSRPFQTAPAPNNASNFPPDLDHWPSENQSNSFQTPQLQQQQPLQRETQTANFGDLTFCLVKENSPAVSRKAYSFILLQLESRETGAHISFRPMISSYRFSTRGERAGPFAVYPMRWRYLSNLAELKDCRLVTVEIGIARRLQDDLPEQF
ncbi:unnamed protein product [Schistocephalus solidus]|uniref:Cysteine and histidine-rich protein 1 n=1 Tax=Schistocephalus solidus TaxID=70667 RepID=A0A183SQ25_SCHSO|nr:unnamed protein product [Schistocephalus solidus]